MRCCCQPVGTSKEVAALASGRKFFIEKVIYQIAHMYHILSVVGN